MHSGKANFDTTAYTPASIRYGLPLPGTGGGTPTLHTSVMSPFGLHILFSPEEILQCKGEPGCKQPLGQETFWEQAASLAGVLPSPYAPPAAVGWRADPSWSLHQPGEPFRAPCGFLCCTCDNLSSFCWSLSDNSQSVLLIFFLFFFLLWLYFLVSLF